MTTETVEQKVENEAAWDEQKLVAFAKGEITLADLEGIGNEQMLEIAKVGHTFLENGKLKDAESIFMGLIALDPTNAYAHLAMGSIHHKNKHFEEAVLAYGRVLEINPYSDSAWVNRGESLIELGDYVLAKENLEHALALEEPSYPDMIKKAEQLLEFMSKNKLGSEE